MAHCSQYSAGTYSYLYSVIWELYERIGYSNLVGVHRTTESSLHFNTTFHGQCGEIMRVLDIRSPKTIAWIGEIGAGYCKPGYHGSARAFDISQIRFTDGSYIDTNYSWRGTLAHKRGYIGLAAQCRLVVGTVLTAWYNTEHQNHIHVDNGVGFVPIRTNVREDAIIIQAACNFVNGESLSIDGAWGPLTEAAFNRLLQAMGATCMSPKTNAYDAGFVIGGIAQAGLNNRNVNYVGVC